MSIVAESTATVQFDSAWVSAVTRVSALAHLKLPEAMHGRIERGTALALTGGVWPADDGQACQVLASEGTHWYAVNGACTCEDYARAPERICKHRAAWMIYRRASDLLHQPLTIALDPEALSEAAPVHTLAGLDKRYLVQLHGKPFVRYAGLLSLAHARGLQSLEAVFIGTPTETLALAQATAIFADGRRFVESADATPQNVQAGVRAHFPRMALVRAKARALRDALGVDVCAVEELSDGE
jgi:hypothetical protein